MTLPRLYTELAHLWAVLSPPEDHAAEAAELDRLLRLLVGPGALKLCELGAGGGSTLAHLSRLGARGGLHDVTAVDLSPAMLRVAAGHMPGLREVVADMRTLTLPDAGTFDAVLAHDAIDYLLTRADLLATARTAAALLRPGGVFLAAPTYTTETFEAGQSEVDHLLVAGAGKRPEEIAYSTVVQAADRGYCMQFSLTVRGADGGTQQWLDVHSFGLFPAATWRETLREAGLVSPTLASEGPWTMFAGLRPASAGTLPPGPRARPDPEHEVHP